jgi:hypothetical protein
MLCCCYVYRATDKGLRTASLIRFIGAEDGLLSHTHDGPRMYVNTEGKICSADCGRVYRTGTACCTGAPLVVAAHAGCIVLAATAERSQPQFAVNLSIRMMIATGWQSLLFPAPANCATYYAAAATQ